MESAVSAPGRPPTRSPSLTRTYVYWYYQERCVSIPLSRPVRMMLLSLAFVLGSLAVVALKQGSVSRHCLDGLLGFV